MLLKGLRRAQLFLPAWLAQRNSAIARQLTSKSSGKASSGESQPSDGRPLSLFEELFPEDSRREKSSTTANGRHKFSVRRLAGSSKLEKQITGTDETTLTWSARRAKNYEDQLRASQDTSVLLLSNASKSLILSDFLRLSPKGEHIDGWASGIIKVIPGRDPITLAPQGFYFILFSSAAAADSYRANLARLHQLARLHTPTSITSPLAPPPGYIRDGEDLHALMQAFTLLPASHQNISVRRLRKPVRPAVQRLVDEGGYTLIVERQSKGGGEDVLVLLALDKGDVGVFDLRAAIGRDGKERNLQWDLVAGKEDIVRIEDGKVVAEEGELGPQPEMLQAGEKDRKKWKRWQRPRFILTFKDGQEARRFVRAWHRRPFPLTTGPQDLGDEAPPIVSAELLW